MGLNPAYSIVPPKFGMSHPNSINCQVPLKGPPWIKILPTLRKFQGVRGYFPGTGERPDFSLGRAKFFTTHCPMPVLILGYLVPFVEIITQKYSMSVKLNYRIRNYFPNLKLWLFLLQHFVTYFLILFLCVSVVAVTFSSFCILEALAEELLRMTSLWDVGSGPAPASL